MFLHLCIVFRIALSIKVAAAHYPDSFYLLVLGGMGLTLHLYLYPFYYCSLESKPFFLLLLCMILS